jgi:zinc transporter
LSVASDLLPAAERGLICAFRSDAHGSVEITESDIAGALQDPQAVTWLHFKLSDARARRWLLESELVPASLREILQEHDENRRVEAAGGGVLMVLSDFSYDTEADPSEVATLWCHASSRLFITVRLHPLKSPDVLRSRLRGGESAHSGVALLAQLIDVRTEQLRLLADQMLEQLNEIEDEIIAGNIRQQREQLGRTRRVCARLRRHFGPERSDWAKFMLRHATVLADEDRAWFASAIEDLGFAIEEISEVYERAKLLQEELASRLAENTGRNLYVLSILTAVFLPMTLVTGIFGMNVSGLPGLSDPHAYWRVMLLIIASGAVTLAVLLWRRLL